MAVHVKTLGVQGEDIAKLDEQLSYQLSVLENSRDWRLIHVETIDSGSYETGGQPGVKATVRAYFREGK